METVYRDYRDKGVQFFYVYKNLQHPETNNYVAPFTLDEKLRHVAEAKRLLKTEIPWICDSMDNDLKRALSAAPNAEFVVDPDGEIVRKRFWSDPAKLRADLEELVGPVDHVTTVDELPARAEFDPRPVASGVVPRIELPGGLTAVFTEPETGPEHPFFAKLRVEATQGLLRQGRGQLYLGVYLDPLYQVHWNNRAGKVTVRLEAPESMDLSETTLESPDVNEDADVDPRQFLIDVGNGDPNQPINISVSYTACDDAETFCLPVTQHYTVRLRRDAFQGSRPGIFMPRMFANVADFDQNGDGDLTADELPPGEVTLYIGHMDFNGNQIIEAEEIANFMSMYNNGRGFDSDKNDGD